MSKDCHIFSFMLFCSSSLMFGHKSSAEHPFVIVCPIYFDTIPFLGTCFLERTLSIQSVLFGMIIGRHFTLFLRCVDSSREIARRSSAAEAMAAIQVGWYLMHLHVSYNDFTVSTTIFGLSSFGYPSSCMQAGAVGISHHQSMMFPVMCQI